MDFTQYQNEAARTHNPTLSVKEMLANWGLGLAGEAGEVVEPIKKHLFHNKDLDVEHMKKEIGDVLWYVSALSTTLGLSLEEVAVHNIEKLKARHPNGWLQ